MKNLLELHTEEKYRLKIFKIITDSLLEYLDSNHVSYINKGNCMDWAFTVKKVLKEKVQLYNVEGSYSFGLYIGTHSFVKITNKFYDSECHSGVTDWRNLPIFTNCRRMDKIGNIYLPPWDLAKKMTEQEFRKYWGWSKRDKNFFTEKVKFILGV